MDLTEVITDVYEEQGTYYKGRLQAINSNEHGKITFSDGMFKVLASPSFEGRKREDPVWGHDIVSVSLICRNNEFYYKNMKILQTDRNIIGRPTQFVRAPINKRPVPQRNENDDENNPNMRLGRRDQVEEENPLNEGNRRVRRRNPREIGENPEREQMIPFNHVLGEIKGTVFKKENCHSHKDDPSSTFFKVSFYDNEREFNVMFWKQKNRENYERIIDGNEYILKRCSKSVNPLNGGVDTYNFNSLSKLESLGKSNNPRPKIVATAFKVCDENLLDVIQFHDIGEVEGMRIGSNLDLLARVNFIKDFNFVKNDKEYDLQEVQIEDLRGIVSIKIWNERIQEFHFRENEIYIFNNLKISSFRGQKELALNPKSVVYYNIPETLIGNQIRNLPINADLERYGANNYERSPPMVIDADLFDNKYLEFVRKDFPNTIVYSLKKIGIEIRDRTMSYNACTNGQCKKKVSRSFSGEYECLSCHKIVVNPRQKLMLKIKLGEKASYTATTFNEEHFKEITGYEFQDFVENYKNSKDNFLIDQIFENAESSLFDVEVLFARTNQGYASVNINVKNIQKVDKREFGNNMNDLATQKKPHGGPKHYSNNEYDELFE